MGLQLRSIIANTNMTIRKWVELGAYSTGRVGISRSEDNVFGITLDPYAGPQMTMYLNHEEAALLWEILGSIKVDK